MSRLGERAGGWRFQGGEWMTERHRTDFVHTVRTPYMRLTDAEQPMPLSLVHLHRRRT